MLNQVNSETILLNHIRYANIQGTYNLHLVEIQLSIMIIFFPEHGDNASNYTELTDATIQGVKGNSNSATESRNQLNDQNQTSTRNGDN